MISSMFFVAMWLSPAFALFVGKAFTDSIAEILA